MLGAYDYSNAHKPGKAIAHADGLSRLQLPDTLNITPNFSEVAHLKYTLLTLIVTAETIRKRMDNDPVLSRVRQLVPHGWTISNPDPQLLPFHSHWRELSVFDGCVLWGSRVTIPSVGQHIVLELLNDCHPVDAYSKWIEAAIVPSTSSKALIKILRSVFATHGVTEHMVSDNGLGFTSEQFQLFTQQNGIKHSYTSPYHP
uniref:Integrase catalytic domain-containing protein n=1 Tax=Amphimedon queenslandica TaxID=400682 RepID=A0A1X7TNA0_AMPQE